ncbi:MAG TPA: site-2 protease family protein [Clostridia bacterium]|nr:site-2 protease family protein [Clostridia bacterium]
MAATHITTHALRLEVKPGALILFPILLALTNFSPLNAWAVVGCLLLHELGHWLAARAFGVGVEAIGICAWGGFISRERSVSPWHNAAISLAGPAVSLVLFIAFGFAQQGTFAAINLLLFVGNLLPVPGTDGWRAFKAFTA